MDPFEAQSQIPGDIEDANPANALIVAGAFWFGGVALVHYGIRENNQGALLTGIAVCLSGLAFLLIAILALKENLLTYL